MGEQHGLGVLQVRAPGHDRGRVPLGLRRERVHEVDDEVADDRRVVEQVEAHERRDLIVAAAARPQATAQVGTHDRQERRLERSVHILVAGLGDELARLDAAQQLVEPRVHGRGLLVVEVARGGERRRVRVRSRDVVARELPVEVGRAAQRGELGRRSAREARAPERSFTGLGHLAILQQPHE